MYTDCENCNGQGEIYDITCGLVPPILHCKECDGNGYYETGAESVDEESDDDTCFIDDESADIAAGEHFAARGN